MEKQTFAAPTSPSRWQIKMLAKGLRRLRQAPEVRPEKIHLLSRAIRSNTYHVDSRKLADCLITSLLLGFLR